jgi:hypothetical protein
MKYIILTIFCLLFYTEYAQENTKCYHEDTARLFIQAKESLDMGGISSRKQGAIFNKNSKFLPWETKFPRVRITKHEYTEATINVRLHANKDSGYDRFSIYYDGIVIYSTDFGDETKEVIVHLTMDVPRKLKFKIDNPMTVNESPGAFQATIRINGQIIKN